MEVEDQNTPVSRRPQISLEVCATASVNVDDARARGMMTAQRLYPAGSIALYLLSPACIAAQRAAVILHTNITMLHSNYTIAIMLISVHTIQYNKRA